MELSEKQLAYLKSLDSKKKKRKFLLDCLIENVENFEISELLSNQFQFDGKWVKVQKPEIGIKPLWLHNELRLKEINDAIDRYVSNSQEIPSEWMFEKRLLESTIKKPKYSPKINQRKVTEQGSELLKFDILTRKHQLPFLTEFQKEGIEKWMHDWEQLTNTSIPIRFLEDCKNIMNRSNLMIDNENHLCWVFNRLVLLGENPNFDYMIKLREIANKYHEIAK